MPRAIIILVALVLLALPVGVFAARFDWSSGVPSIVDNSTCPQVRYDWSQGVPSMVYNATVSCGSGALKEAGTVSVSFVGSVIISNGVVRFAN